MPSRLSAPPAALDCRSPLSVSRRSKSSRAPWGSASPWRRNHSCLAMQRCTVAAEWGGGVGPGASVATPEGPAAPDLPPLLVRRPLEAYLDGLGLGSGPIE